VIDAADRAVAAQDAEILWIMARLSVSPNNALQCESTRHLNPADTPQSAALVRRNLMFLNRPRNCRLLVGGVVYDADELRGRALDAVDGP
jgi:hypothetical protein